MAKKKKQKNPDSRIEFSMVSSIGDELTEEQLDDLWDAVVLGERGQCSYMAQWWDDKPHQILYRLLARLTRAENRRRRVR